MLFALFYYSFMILLLSHLWSTLSCSHHLHEKWNTLMIDWLIFVSPTVYMQTQESPPGGHQQQCRFMGLLHLTTASHMPIFYIQSRQRSVGLCWEKTSKGFVELTERPWLCWTAAVVHAGLCVFSLPCFYSAQLLAYLLVALLYKLDFTEKLLFKCSESLIVKVCAGWRPNAERINKMDRR